MTREELLVQLMKTGTGYEVDMYGMLYLRPLENGDFVVGCEDHDKPKNEHWEKCFEDPVEAVNFFEKTRKEQKLGFEFEIETKPETKPN